MKVDFHVHSNHSDGQFSVREIIHYANEKKVNYLSITDHDTLSSQEEAILLADQMGIRYIPGIELNVILSNPDIRNGKDFSLDLLAYNIDIRNEVFLNKIKEIAEYRSERMKRIVDNLNGDFIQFGIPLFNDDDIRKIKLLADGTIGRPHIAKYLIEKKIVSNIQEAFDKYLVKHDVPKYRFILEDAIEIIHQAGGIAILAHPNDPHGTSLNKITKNLKEQLEIIKKYIIDKGLDGIECWHSRNDENTTETYFKFALDNSLLISAGSDCHQKPVKIGDVDLSNRQLKCLFIFQ